MPKGGKKKRKREPSSFGGLEEVSDHQGSSSGGGGHAHGKSTHGPPVATTSGRLSGSVPNDEWQTTRRTWASIAEYFAAYKQRRVWMPFFYDGACADHLRSLGFTNVVHEDVDFFERVKDAKFMKSVDLILDNPPYTTPEMKEKVLRAIASTDKPFVLLLPISILHVAFVRDIVPMDLVQAIIPRRVWVKKRDAGEIPFKYLCWFCCRTALERDLLFVDDDEGDVEE
jgi:hypothetical protein